MAGRCSAGHPSLPIQCEAPARYPNHDHHFAVHDDEPVEWVNPNFVPPEPKGKKRGPSPEDKAIAVGMQKMAEALKPKPEPSTEAPEPSTLAPDDQEDEWNPIAGASDPATSHIAAERIEPQRDTRKAAVLEYLRAASGGWVDGSDIATAEVGGSEGLRRLRELKDEGWLIDRRPHPTSATAWQYRLLQDPPQEWQPLDFS